MNNNLNNYPGCTNKDNKRTLVCKQCKRDIVISTDKTYYHCADHKLYEELIDLLDKMHEELNLIERTVDSHGVIPLDHLHFKLTSLLKYLSNLTKGWKIHG